MTPFRYRGMISALGIVSVSAAGGCSKQDQSVTTTDRAEVRPANATATLSTTPTISGSCDACKAIECPDPQKAVGEQCAGGKCDALLRCVAQSRCDRKTRDPSTKRNEIDLRFCYCGDDFLPASIGECFLPTENNPVVPHGACKTEIEQLAGAPAPLDVAKSFFDQETPLGAVSQMETCQDTRCYKACF